MRLIKVGDKVGASEATLLNMLNISPFTYGLQIEMGTAPPFAFMNLNLIFVNFVSFYIYPLLALRWCVCANLYFSKYLQYIGHL